MSKILVGSTIPAFKALETADQWGAWLYGAHEIETNALRVRHDLEWIVTLQQDARGDRPFERLLVALAAVNATVYRYMIDLGQLRITTNNRFVGICIGRNLIIEHALNDPEIEWIYFADSDIEAPPDVLPKLLELGDRFKVIGAHVPTYALGHDAPKLPGTVGDSRVHWNTAGSLLVHRDVFRRVPWRWNPDEDGPAGPGDVCSDDPATQHEMERLGYPTVVRHDVICRHYPQSVLPLEDRAHDLEVYR